MKNFPGSARVRRDSLLTFFRLTVFIARRNH
jgi:hypothetical protein